MEFCHTMVIVLTFKLVYPGCWHNGSMFIICPGDCPFESDPSPISADACGEVTGCNADCQEVDTCSTRGESQGCTLHSPKQNSQ